VSLRNVRFGSEADISTSPAVASAPYALNQPPSLRGVPVGASGCIGKVNDKVHSRQHADVRGFQHPFSIAAVLVQEGDLVRADTDF